MLYVGMILACNVIMKNNTLNLTWTQNVCFIIADLLAGGYRFLLTAKRRR